MKTMSKAKYKQGKQICSIKHFEDSQSNWFKWNGKTVHRSVLMSLQYRTLLSFITGGKLYEADPIDPIDPINQMDTDKYELVVWKYGRIVDRYVSYDKQMLIDYYNRCWKWQEYFGDCCCDVSINDEILSIPDVIDFLGT